MPKTISPPYRVAGLLVSLLALNACGTGQGAAVDTKLETVTAVVIQGTQMFPIQVMQDKGIDKKHGFDLEVTPVAGPSALYPAMQDKDFQIGFGVWASNARLRDGGVPITNIYSLNQITNEVLVPVNSKIQSISDLRGKKVGVYGGPGGGSTTWFRMVTQKLYGFDLLKDTEVIFGSPGILAGQLASGQLDAALLVEPANIELIEKGQARSIGDIGAELAEETGITPLFVTVTANEDWAAANPETASNLVAAMRESVQYIQDNPDVWEDLGPKVGITSDDGINLLREKAGSAFLLEWNETLIDEQMKFADMVTETLGESGDFPAAIPNGTFSFDYISEGGS
jgi:NitT/TauT family transport system substrate-binding protein